MEEKITPAVKTPNMLAFKGALAYSLYFLVLIYVLKVTGVSSSNPDDISTLEKITSQVASYIPFILAIVFVQTNYKKEMGGYITFAKAFSSGFKVAAYAGLFIAISMIVYYKVLDTMAFDDLMKVASAKAASSEQRAQGFEKMKPYMVLFIGFGSAITYTFFGLIVSLVGAAVVKKEAPIYTEE